MFGKILKKIRKNNRGFTLVELVVVIAILGMLSLIAVPKITTSKKTAAISVHNANIKTLENAASMYIAEKGKPSEAPVEWEENSNTKASDIAYADNNPNKAWVNYLQEWPMIPEGLAKIDGGKINPKEAKYKVVITKEGNITVTPGHADENGNIN